MFLPRLGILTNRAHLPRLHSGARRPPSFRPHGEELEDRCVPAVVFSENFDGVTAPALPAGWTATNVTGPAPLWTTTTAGPDTGPNAAVINDSGSTSDKQLTSPVIAIPNGTTGLTLLTFKHTFATESGFDGGRLYISINGGASTEFTSAGGSFSAGGYTDNFRSGGGAAWTGTIAGGFGTYGFVQALLPSAALGQNIQLRWRMTNDGNAAGTGWKVDTISIESVAGLTATAGTPQSTPATTPFPTNLQVTAFNDTSTPVSGLLVTFTAPGAGASVTFPNGNTATTDSNGLASVPVVANSVGGSYTVSATAPGYLSTSSP